MVSPAMIATQLGGGAAGPARALWLDGLDILKQPGSAANRYGVPIESIDVEEAGPGGVSSMRFRLELPNPASGVTLVDGARVHFQDLANDLPTFYGFLQSWPSRPLGLGRSYDVTCQGIEIVLDWMIVPALTIAAGTNIQAAIQSILANATGVGVALRGLASGTANGTQAQPIGDLAQPKFGGAVTTAVAVVLAGDSVREAIRKVLDVANDSSPYFGDITIYGHATVDFWQGLRVFRRDQAPGDYATLTIDDSVGGAIAAANLEHTTDVGQVVRGVYVKGGNAAGTGLVSDGSGKPGRIAVIDDPSILTSSARDLAGVAYLTTQTEAARGNFQVEAFTPTTNVRPGSRLSLTDAEVGLTAANYAISTISKTFAGPTESWRVSYGGLPKKAGRVLRRLTRGTRS